jgi:hypothetical protein
MGKIPFELIIKVVETIHRISKVIRDYIIIKDSINGGKQNDSTGSSKKE